jgi:hypothetical protein
MKKLLLLAFALMALSITFTSCSDDDEKTPDSLVGTSWAAKIQSSMGGLTISLDVTIKFTTETAFTQTSVLTGFDPEIETGTYTYAKPNITLLYEGDDDALTGTIDGNKMTFVEGTQSVVFTKK